MLYNTDMKRLMFLLILVAMAACIAGCFGEPKTLDELTQAGDAAFTAEKYAEARAFYQKGLHLKPSDRHLLYFTGMTFRREAQYDSALAYLKRADLLHPGDREINLEIHDMAVQTEQHRYAIDAIKALVSAGDPEQPYWRELAELYAKDSSPMMTFHYQRLIVNQHPDSPEEYMRLVSIALAIESSDVAKDYLDSAAARFGERNEITANRAFILAYERKYDQAEALFRKALAADSTIIGFRLGLANVLSMSDDKRKLTEALGQFRMIRARLGEDQYNIDSLITDIENRLK